MKTWDDQDDGDTAAHEFGHMIGMHDEYADAGCPTRSPVNTRTVMDDVTGPIAQRHVHAVCQGRPGEPPVAAGNVVRKPPAEPPTSGSTTRSTNPPGEPAVKYQLSISGGPPGERVEHVVSVDEMAKTSTYVFRDQLHKVARKELQAPYSPDTTRRIKAAFLENRLPAEPESPPRFPPDSLVATLAVEVGGKQKVIRYPVEEAAVTPGEPIKSGLAGLKSATLPTSVTGPVRELHETMVMEAARVAEASLTPR